MKTKNKRNYSRENGITLIALVVTIVVLLILAGVSVNALFGNSGIIEKAKEAQNAMDKAKENDEKGIKELSNWLDSKINGTADGSTADGIPVLVGTEKITLTKDNVGNYLGKVVINYTGATSVTIDEKAYTVSSKYRLYYVDFDNKYGDGAGTIYLKADCTSNNYFLQLDTTAATETNIKIKNLNPELYKSGVTPPTATNGNMKAVTWLTNTNNWTNLKDTSMSSSINYIVGTPSLEMMMDSYNTHYGLRGDTPKTSTITAGTRTKLFYQYTTSTNGYKVGPGEHVGFALWTSLNSVYTDTAIDSMYYPGTNKGYWLASPSTGGAWDLLCVKSGNGGYIDNWDRGNTLALCPLVSLQSSVNLTLEK